MQRRSMLQGALALLFGALTVPVQAQALKPMKLTLNFLAGGPQAGFMRDSPCQCSASDSPSGTNASAAKLPISTIEATLAGS